MTLLSRQIDVTFRLASGSFAESGTNTLTLSGLRVLAKIVNAGGASMPALDLKIYGMTLSTMNQLSTLGLQVNRMPNNEVLVAAGDSTGAAKTTVFVGNIAGGLGGAYTDFSDQANVAFSVHAAGLGAQAVLSSKPQSFTGSTDVASILAGLATQMGITFQNNGVTSKLSNQYLYGSARSQALKVVRAAIPRIKWNTGEGGVLAIWPATGNRGGAMPVISPTTGMESYPTYTANGLQFTTLFNPSISFGGLVQVKSSLPAASQTVYVGGLDHDLHAQVPGGRWHSTIRGYNPSLPPGTVLPP